MNTYALNNLVRRDVPPTAQGSPERPKFNRIAKMAGIFSIALLSACGLDGANGGKNPLTINPDNQKESVKSPEQAEAIRKPPFIMVSYESDKAIVKGHFLDANGKSTRIPKEITVTATWRDTDGSETQASPVTAQLNGRSFEVHVPGNKPDNKTLTVNVDDGQTPPFKDHNFPVFDPERIPSPGQ